MSTITFEYEGASGGAFAIRVIGLTGSQAGQVLDFNDNTFKAIGSATTPYAAATERTGINGTGKSSYTIALNLANVNSSEVAQQYLVKWYTGATPATTVTPVKSEAIITVLFGAIAGEVTVEFEINVKSTAGAAAQIGVWLIHRGEKVDLTTIDATPALSVEVREHASGSALFTATGDDTDVFDKRFEVEQASPGFTDDRQYAAEVVVTLGSTVFRGSHSFSVQGA